MGRRRARQGVDGLHGRSACQRQPCRRRVVSRPSEVALQGRRRSVRWQTRRRFRRRCVLVRRPLGRGRRPRPMVDWRPARQPDPHRQFADGERVAVDGVRSSVRARSWGGDARGRHDPPRLRSVLGGAARSDRDREHSRHADRQGLNDRRRRRQYSRAAGVVGDPGQTQRLWRDSDRSGLRLDRGRRAVAGRHSAR